MKNRKNRAMAIGVIALVAVLAALGGVHAGISTRNQRQDKQVGIYVEPYQAMAIAYLEANAEVAARYDHVPTVEPVTVILEYTTDTYDNRLFGRVIPADAEEFEANVAYMEFYFILDGLDGRYGLEGDECAVRVEKNAEGVLAVSGHRFTDTGTETAD